MQDRYVSDIGDFGKYGLLRALTTEPDRLRQLRLGVNWYAVPNESGTNDGRFIDYLKEGNPQSRIRMCDEGLYLTLRKIVASGVRSLAEVERLGVLPPDTAFFGELQNFGVE